MSLANIKQMYQQAYNPQHPQLQLAALKMEMDKLEQLRQQWEDVENKNVEQLTTLLSNVEKFKKRTNNPILKAQVAIGKYMDNNMWLWVGLGPVMVGTACMGLVAGFAMGGHQLNMMPFVGSIVGFSAPMAAGLSCVLTAEKYEEKAKSDAHSELFRLLPKLASSSNPQLNTCMQQLYQLGSDEKIPGPFWQQCVMLLREIHLAHKKFQSQHDRVEQKREDLIENDPQTLHTLKNQSFAQRHQNFVKVNVESTQDIQEQSANGESVKNPSTSAIKI